MEYKYNGIKIDSDFDLEFVKEYHYQQTNILRLLNEGDINQDQFQQLQSQYFENSYKDFFLNKVNCQTDLIELI